MIVSLKNKQKCMDIFKEHKVSIILPPPTRWSYYFDSIANLLKIREVISFACVRAGIDDLANSEYEVLEHICIVLSKYNELIKKLEFRDSKVSKVIPILSSLKAFLNQQTYQSIKNLCETLLKDFESRFEYIFFI